MIVIVHVPKTAGTSLWLAIKKRYGRKRVAFDYGEKSEVTSQLVRQHMYTPRRAATPGPLIKTLTDNDYVALTGHFPLARYASCVDSGNVIAFVREPLVRACSEYLHRFSDGTFTGTIENFIETNDFQNLQARLLAGLTGKEFVGITELYRESVQMINQRFGLRIRIRRDNRGPTGGGEALAGTLGSSLVQRFYELNRQDVLLYQSMLKRFEALRPISNRRSFIYR